MTSLTKDPGHTGLPPDYDSPPQQPVQQQESEYLLVSIYAGLEEVETFTAAGAQKAKEYQARLDYKTTLYVKVRD